MMRPTSLPRELYLRPDRVVVGRPIAALAALRREHLQTRPLRLQPRQIEPIEPSCGDTLEIQAEILIDRYGEAGLIVRRSPDGSEETRISYNPMQRQLTLERLRASEDATTARSASPTRISEH